MYLAAIADSQPQAPAVHSQVIKQLTINVRVAKRHVLRYKIKY